MTQFKFNQVDVFTTGPLTGNPLAVVHDADELSTDQMAKVAHWQNLSETTFVLKPTHPDADYRVRIFTPNFELPFAGHPTLGTARAVLNNGLKPKNDGFVVQECEKGLIKVRIDGHMLYFSSPQAIVDPYSSSALAKAVGSKSQSLSGAAVDVGARFVVLPMESAEQVRSFAVDSKALSQVCQEARVTGLMTYGPNPSGSVEPKYETRMHFILNGAVAEDPVCGSGTACVARYLEKLGERSDYDVRQGTCLGRKGLLRIKFTDDELYVGGEAVVTTEGLINI